MSSIPNSAIPHVFDRSAEPLIVDKPSIGVDPFVFVAIPALIGLTVMAFGLSTIRSLISGKGAV
jgi:hypothetical protein